jgi:subfamily B ATP-binding cassette protein MsbA
VLERFDGSIRFENVTFRYAPNLQPALRCVSLEIRKGEIAAFVGPSGAGKTTLINLIPRFFNVDEGRVLIDGADIRDYTLASLRRMISVVTQETILFNISIAENIAYSSDTVDMDKVAAAARVANAESFIRSAPQSFETVVGERGVRLSGGQKQRISIARAMLKNTPILILDEATSSLDTESEQLVQEAIDSLMKNRTVLVIAHRLSTVMHADKIVVLDHGRILDVGPHRQLLASCPLYKKLYDMQFRDE